MWAGPIMTGSGCDVFRYLDFGKANLTRRSQFWRRTISVIQIGANGDVQFGGVG
jgi:hypothetical protein